MNLPAGAGGTQIKRPLPRQDLPPWDAGNLVDWVGVNYFTRQLVRHDPSSPQGYTVEVNERAAEKSETGAEIYPEGLEVALRETARRFTYPIVVTANGLADERDVQRSAFIRSHLKALDQALRGSRLGPPLDIRGYLHWSLLDGFHWLSGYQPKTGLIEVDFKRGNKRTIRNSALYYSLQINRYRGSKFARYPWHDASRPPGSPL